MPYNPTVHHRRSTRLRDFDYSAAGAYFVTICVHGRECVFGEVEDRTVRLNEWGEITRDEWLKTEEMRDNVTLDQFIVMPNHFHGIVFIHDVGAHCMRPHGMQPDDDCDGRQNRAHINAPLQRRPGSLGSIVAGFKSAVTKRINQARGAAGTPVWQRNYYERIIQGESELNDIRQYIADNPLQWAEDENHPGRC